MYQQIASMLNAFVFLMSTHPDVYQRLQAEMDTKIGLDRLPDFSDRIQLPYLNASIKELLRLV